MLNIAKSIKNLRTDNNYTQEGFAALCGVSRQAVAKWESGENLPDIQKLLLLSQHFHISVDALLTGKDMSVQGDPDVIQAGFLAQNERIVNQALRNAMSFHDPDEMIFRFIAYIGDKIGCDRIYIFEQKPDTSYRNTYEWCDKGVTPQINYLQSIPLEDMSIWLKAFSQGKYVFIEDVDEIADSEPAVYRWLKPQSIRSILVCPLFGGLCFLGVDNPASAFITQTSSMLEIMTHFVEIMLQRRDLEQKLAWTTLQNNQFGKLNNGLLYRLNFATGELQYDTNLAKELGYQIRPSTLSQLEDVALSHPEFHDHLMLDGLQKAVETKENLSIEFLSYKSNRTVRWNRLSICPLLNHDGTVLQLFGILQDISNNHKIVEQYNRCVSHLSGGMHICYLSNPIHLDYASDDLCRFLGYSRDEFEKVVCTKYTNIIAEEDRAAFIGYAKRLAAAPGIESCEYRLCRNDGTFVSVIDTMESVADSNGIMYGYAHVLAKSDLHAMLELAETAAQKQMSYINRQYEVIEALGKDYLNVFRVWLDEDKAQIVKLSGYVTKGMNRESAEYIPYYRFCKQYIQDRVHPEDRKKMLTAMHPDTVRESLSSEDEYLVVYRAVDHDETHFYQLKYVRLNDEKGNNTINFVAGFKNVDKVIEEEFQQKEKLQSRLNIINAILKAFACGYYYSFKDDTFTELTNENEYLAKLTGKTGNFNENQKRMKTFFPDTAAFSSINDFLDTNTLEARLNGKKYISTQVFISGYGWYELYVFVVDYDNDGKLSHCIFVARDITQTKEKEKEYIRSLDISSRRIQDAMQIAYRDTLTGVMNRNAYENTLRSVNNDGNIGIIFCDVNNLKKTNDIEGHDKGDMLLRNFAELLKKNFSIDCIYRIGGDEFVCLIENIEKDSFLNRVKVFMQVVTEHGDIAAIGAAFGLSEQKELLLQEAERKMYDKKKSRSKKFEDTAVSKKEKGM